MEQFILVPASIYSKSLNTQSVTQRYLPANQPSKKTAYQKDSLRREINKKTSAKADPSVDKFSSCPRVKLSTSQFLNLDAAITGVLLPHFDQQLSYRQAAVPRHSLRFT